MQAHAHQRAHLVRAERPRLVLLNLYPPYERPTDEVHIVGKMLWKITRA